jgi:adenylate cyclase
MRTMSAEVLARVLGTTVEQVDELVRAGALHPTDGAFTSADVPRGRAAIAYLDAGLSHEQLGTMIADRLIRFEAVGDLFMEPAPLSGRTFDEFCAAHREEAAIIPRVYTALGLPEPQPSTLMREDEERLIVELIGAWRQIGDDETIARAARLMGENIRRAIQGWLDLFRERATAAGGLPPPGRNDEADEQNAVGQRLAALAPPLLVWLEQRFLEHTLFATNVEELERVLPTMDLGIDRPSYDPAIAFVDLAGFTALTERGGDEVAVRSAVGLQDVCEAIARAHGGRLVKLLGDGAMLYFPEPVRAVRACLDVLDRADAVADARVHIGLNTGPLVARDGDYFGHTVNLAARIAGVAAPGSLLVTEPIAAAWADGTVRFEPMAPVRVKGVSEPVAVFAASRGAG